MSKVYFDNDFKDYIKPLSHSYRNFSCTNPLTFKCMPGPRDNGGHLPGFNRNARFGMVTVTFGMVTVTVDLQGVLTICTHVGFQQGRCEHVTFASVKCHIKVTFGDLYCKG